MARRKAELVQELIVLIENEMNVLQKSLDSASEAATHPESKPENKYDTRGLEASYLAGAQRERLGELRAASHFLRNMPLRDFQEDDRIAASAIVELEHEGRRSFYFLLPFGAGLSLEWDEGPLLVLTPQSPLGQALLHKAVGDAVKIRTGAVVKDYEIIRLL